MYSDAFGCKHILIFHWMYSNPNPRGALVKEYIKSLACQENRLRRANFHDRGIGTFADGYLSLEELSTISNEFFKNGFSVGIRDRCSFLLAHYAMIRGENIRNLEFADLLSVELPNEGTDCCIALVLMMLQGKTTFLHEYYRLTL
jgi:hypothetical protein